MECTARHRMVTVKDAAKGWIKNITVKPVGEALELSIGYSRKPIIPKQRQGAGFRLAKAQKRLEGGR